MNPILNTDSYKLSHYLQYPKDIKFVSSYIESRGGRWNRLIFYGLQAFLIKYLSQKINAENINEANEFAKSHGLPFNKQGWEHILNEHGGALPLYIEALNEGTIIGTENVLLQVKNTDEKVPWLVGWIETALLRSIWYPVAVATQSYFCKQTILHFLNETGDMADGEFALHDFGARGVSSFESAGIGGSAHLLNFGGSDTITGALFAMKYYGAKMPALSIPASEHSTMISWGKDNEKQAFDNMCENFGDGVFACVIDSYDALNAIDLWAKNFDEIKQRGGRVVLRPDSGNPVTMASECLERIMSHTGFSINEKGYKLLPPFVRLIYGDGITPESISDILNELKMRRISASNITFGMGGALLQHLNRDTLRFAMKVNAISNDGKTWHDVFKSPNTDISKRSKGGVLALIKQDGIYHTIKHSELNGQENELKPVFKNGEILRKSTFDEIKERIKEHS